MVVKQRFRSLWSLVGLTVLALVGIAWAQQPLPAAPRFGALVLIACALAYVATALILLRTLRIDGRRSMAVLALTALGAAAIVVALRLAIPFGSTVPRILVVSSATGAWLHTFWYLLLALGAFSYIAVRRYEDAGHVVSDRMIAALSGATFVLVAGGIAFVFLAADALPLLNANGDLTKFRTTGVGVILALVLFGAAGAVLRIRRPGPISQALAMSLCAAALDDLVTMANGPRFSLGYYAARIISVGSPFFLLSADFQRLLRAFDRLRTTEATLERTQHTAMLQSERLAAVWRLVRNERMDDQTRFQGILDTGASLMRRDRPFFGTLRRVDGDDVVIVLNSSTTHVENPRLHRNRAAVGDRVPIKTTFSADILATGATITLDNLDRIGTAVRSERTHSLPFNSIIGTTFTVATTTYVLSFAAREATDNDPFTDDDRAFIDMLASFLSSQLHSGRQLAQIRYQIEHDLLTGLPNRSTFRSAASTNIGVRIPSAVVVIDLDRFREINETFGHMTGDALLVEIAAGLNRARQSGDVIARLGGDNFGILIDDVRGGVDIEARLQPYRDVFAQPLITGDRTGKDTLYVGASFGIALYPQDATTFEDLLARADAAVDLAKQRQRGSVAFFNEALSQSIERRRTLHIELAKAVATDELNVYYQPTIDLATGNVTGAEALARWDHSQRGLVLPDEFIPFAEKNGLIRSLGRWVMHRAVRDVDAMTCLPEGFICYINLSSHQLGDLGFVSDLRDELAKHPRALGHIGVEITETVAMQDADRTLNALTILHELGIVVALDDFGTGYSSLSYLKRFPIDVIKIDRSFVVGLPNDEHDIALVETVIAVAGHFGFTTLAEGIETDEQRNWLRGRGCRYGQGFAIAPPMALADFVSWLEHAALASR